MIKYVRFKHGLKVSTLLTGVLSFEEAGLRAHNIFRKIHKSKPMKLDDDLSKEAAEYAKKIASEGKLEHSKTEDGENLAMGCSPEAKMDALEATRNW